MRYERRKTPSPQIWFGCFQREFKAASFIRRLRDFRGSSFRGEFLDAKLHKIQKPSENPRWTHPPPPLSEASFFDKS